MSERYNGWTNYETWAVKLWMDNEQSSYNYWNDQAKFFLEEATASNHLSKVEQAVNSLAESIKEEFAENNPLADTANVYADLLGAALSEVNWHEISRHLIDDAKE